MGTQDLDLKAIPLEYALHENYPNPFNPTTTLRFDLPEVSNITLTIYNMLGRLIPSTHQPFMHMRQMVIIVIRIINH